MQDLKPNEIKLVDGERWEKKGTEIVVTIQYYYGINYWNHETNTKIQVDDKTVYTELRKQGDREMAEQRAREFLKKNYTVGGQEIVRTSDKALNYRLSWYQAKKKAELKNF